MTAACLRTAFAAVLVCASAFAAAADQALQAFVTKTLTDVREKDHLPAVAALVHIDGKTEAEAAVGLRALERAERVTIDDRWHIGSDTKAFTATLIAVLADHGVLSLDDTMTKCFPAFAADIDPAYRNITLTQLLSHTGGLPPLTDDKDLPPFLAVLKAAPDLKGQRLAVARTYLARPPASQAGAFEYSNLGYIIAGAAAEQRMGKPWEDLIRERIFTPLGIKNAGFGAPGTSAAFDQPRGHAERNGKLMPLDPATGDDNPPAIGPAGTINIALKDWMLFAEDQLAGVHGRGKLLKPETYRKLHTPIAGNYALGWGVRLGASGAPDLITHSGSNGYWLADIRIMPKHDMIFLVVTNAGNEGANLAVKDIGLPLRDRLKPFD